MGIIVEKYDLPVIELVPLPVCYSLTIEGVTAGDNAVLRQEITSDHFPRLKGKAGIIEEKLFLIRPVPLPNQSYPDYKVREIVQRAGYEFANWPSLGPLKHHTAELWEAGLKYVAARGEASLWQSPRELYAPYLLTSPQYHGFDLIWVENGWTPSIWFVCRKKE